MVVYVTATLPDEVLATILDDLNAAKLRKMLALSYLQVSESCILQLRCQFQKMKRSNKKFLADLRMVTDQLVIIEEPMFDKDIVHRALAGLSSEYKFFCISIDIHHPLLTFEELKALLLQHESQYVNVTSPECMHDVMFAHNTIGSIIFMV